MKMTLFHYLHCPYCIRVRLAAGLIDQKYQSIIVQYDDEATPKKLSGKKMLPIAEINQKPMNESLDIIKAIDTSNVLDVDRIVCSKEYLKLSDFIDELSKPLHSLVMPYWIFTPEFSPTSRSYFQQKKEEKRGPFKNLLKQRSQLEAEVQGLLKKIEEFKFLNLDSNEVNLFDILLASHLWGLYVVPEFQLNEHLHLYLQKIKSKCKFVYHEGIEEFF